MACNNAFYSLRTTTCSKEAPVVQEDQVVQEALEGHRHQVVCLVQGHKDQEDLSSMVDNSMAGKYTFRWIYSSPVQKYRKSKQKVLWSKKVREKSRECHNYKPQLFLDTKRTRK